MSQAMRTVGAAVVAGMLLLTLAPNMTGAVPSGQSGVTSVAPSVNPDSAMPVSVQAAAPATIEVRGVGGDADCDGGPIDCRDAYAFQLWRTDPFVYEQAYAGCELSWWCDCNGDGTCNTFDFNCLVRLYTEEDEDNDGVVNGDDYCPGTPAGTPVDGRGCVRGDLNCDGEVNTFDIDPFVMALTSARTYVITYPDCRAANADANCDGRLDTFDIDPFVLCVTGNCPPCP